MPACPRCGAAAGEAARFCSACGAPLAGDPAPPVQARKVVTVMFADVSGFTALAERHDPESLQQVMSRYFAEMRRVVELHGGTVDMVLGDAIMALFGVPVLHEDDAVRAARCSLEMREALDTLNDEIDAHWGERLRIHTGINTGEVVIGPGDDGQPVTYGDTVNVARRLQESAARGDILVGAVTARLLHGIGRLSPVTPMLLGGRAAAVEAWRLQGIDEDDRGPAGAARALVGRRDELGTLRAAFERVVVSREPAAVTVTGVAGIGKSRLVTALLDEIGDRAAVVAGRCLPYGEGITYWPLAEIVRRLAERPEVSAIAEAAGGGIEARTIAHRLARVVGMAPGTVAVEEAHWAVRRLLEVRAAHRPLVVVVDDIHWAEPTMLDLLEHVTTVARDVPLLLVLLARPELLERRPGWGADSRSTIVALGPLPAGDAAVLFAELAAGTGIGGTDAERVLATAEGNPFFLEQIVALRAGGAAGTPASIHALLAARIDSLPPTERAVVDRAAVEGHGFHRSALAELLPAAARGRLDTALEGLTRRRLIRPGLGELPGEAGYRFVHILVRDVVYELLPKAARAELHERYAAWLDQRAGRRYAELVGYHLEQAHRWHAELRPSAAAERHALATAAAGRLAAAGQAALQRGDIPAGVNLLERTVALLPPGDPARAPLLTELALALVQVGRLPEAESLLSQAVGIARAGGDARAEAHARTAQLFALVQMSPDAAPAAMSVRFDGLNRTFTTAGDDLGRSRLYRAEALVHWLAGQTAKADAAWKRGVRHARLAGDEQGVADGLVWQASAAALGPRRAPDAIADCRAILDQLQTDRRSQALSMRPLAHLHAMTGQFDLARDLVAESRAIHAELGVGLHAAAADVEASIAFLAVDPAAAEAVLRPSLEQLFAMGDRALAATIAAMLARALAEQGRDDEAWELSETVEGIAADGDTSVQILRRCVRGQLLVRRGELDEADRLTAEAVAIARRTDWLVERGDALMTRGEVLRARGLAEQADRAFHRAFALYTRKGDVVSACRARAVVAAVPASRAARH
jgi:class 3 adenylate cyclase/tetratricopeptide (TPR) repeat protein